MADPLKQSDKYRCSDAACGCEIEVTRGCDKCPASSPQPPTCCCGKPMVKA